MVSRKEALKRMFTIVFGIGFTIFFAKNVLADYIFRWKGNELFGLRNDASSFWGTPGDIRLGHSVLQVMSPKQTLMIDLGDNALRFNKLFLGDDIDLSGGANIVLSTSTGTKVGTATAQLLGFWNATPVNQPDTIADPASTTAANNTAIIAIIDRLQEAGLIA